jgi:hypothetical protein
VIPKHMPRRSHCASGAARSAGLAVYRCSYWLQCLWSNNVELISSLVFQTVAGFDASRLGGSFETVDSDSQGPQKCKSTDPTKADVRPWSIPVCICSLWSLFPITFKGPPHTLELTRLSAHLWCIGLLSPFPAIEGWIIVVNGVHEEAQEEDIYDKFAEYGEVTIALPLDRRSGYVKGYALIEYQTKAEAQAAIEACNGSELLDSTLTVDWALSRGPIKKRMATHRREDTD